PKVYRCTSCPKTFPTRSACQRHQHTHDPDYKPCRCESCGRGFARNDTLRRHLKSRVCM
ncbi:hypothetical protein DFS34DRAFT_582056, partial [Phlyctochytrium arcticum]